MERHERLLQPSCDTSNTSINGGVPVNIPSDVPLLHGVHGASAPTTANSRTSQSQAPPSTTNPHVSTVSRHTSRDTGLYRLEQGSAVKARVFHYRTMLGLPVYTASASVESCASMLVQILAGIGVWFLIAAAVVLVAVLLPLGSHSWGLDSHKLNYWSYAYGFNLWFLLAATFLSLFMLAFGIPGPSPSAKAAIVVLCLAAGCVLSYLTLKENMFASSFERLSAPYLNACINILACVTVSWGFSSLFALLSLS